MGDFVPGRRSFPGAEKFSTIIFNKKADAYFIFCLSASNQIGGTLNILGNASGRTWIFLAILSCSVAQHTGAAVPHVSNYTPSSGTIGTLVSFSGDNFSPVPAENIVYFGAVRGTVMQASTSNLLVQVPASATFARPTVTVAGLTAYGPTAFMPSFSGDLSPFSASNFAPGFNLSAGDGPTTVVLADIDGDGKPDLIVGNGYEHTFGVFRNISTNGQLSAASFAAPVNFPCAASPDSNPYKLAVADLDGDGKLDLIVSGTDLNQIALWRNTSVPGTITMDSFAGPILLDTGADCRSAQCGGEPDRDGASDNRVCAGY